MRRWLPWIGGGIALVVVVAVIAVLVVGTGAGSANEAFVTHVDEDADDGSAAALASREWGDGRLVLVGYDRGGERVLGLGYAGDGLLGWQVASYTEEQVEPDDVVVGSLLVASAPGGSGQPAWSAAVGEIADSRVDQVEVTWANGDTSTGERTDDDAYIVAAEGETEAMQARYLAADGTEIAQVPVATAEG